MKAKYLVEKTIEELTDFVKKSTKELSEMLLDLRMGKQADTSKVRKTKKAIARAKTILKEKQIIELNVKSGKIDQVDDNKENK